MKARPWLHSVWKTRHHKEADCKKECKNCFIRKVNVPHVKAGVGENSLFFWKRWCHWPAAASRPQTTSHNNDGQWICMTATKDDQPEIFSSSRTTTSSKQEWTITHGAGLGSTVDCMPSPAFLFSHLVFWVGWLGYWPRKPLLLLYLLPHYTSSCTNNALDKCSQVYHPPSSIHTNLEPCAYKGPYPYMQRLGLRKLHTESTILYNFIEYLFWFSSSNGENISSVAEKHFPFMFRGISCPPKVFLFYSFWLFQGPCQRLQFKTVRVRLSLGCGCQSCLPAIRKGSLWILFYQNKLFEHLWGGVMHNVSQSRWTSALTEIPLPKPNASGLSEEWHVRESSGAQMNCITVLHWDKLKRQRLSPCYVKESQHPLNLFIKKTFIAITPIFADLCLQSVK